jgi:hypothetical protein
MFLNDIYSFETLSSMQKLLIHLLNTKEMNEVNILQLKSKEDKGRIKSSLCLTKHHDMKAYCGMKAQLHAFLTSALEGGEWSASRPGRFSPGKEPTYPLDTRLSET